MHVMVIPPPSHWEVTETQSESVIVSSIIQSGKIGVDDSASVMITGSCNAVHP